MDSLKFGARSTSRFNCFFVCLADVQSYFSSTLDDPRSLATRRVCLCRLRLSARCSAPGSAILHVSQPYVRAMFAKICDLFHVKKRESFRGLRPVPPTLSLSLSLSPFPCFCSFSAFSLSLDKKHKFGKFSVSDQTVLTNELL